MAKPDDTSDAKKILDRVEDDQRSMIAPDARVAEIDENDPVEVWARRVGRIVGYALLVALIVNLFTGWLF